MGQCSGCGAMVLKELILNNFYVEGVVLLILWEGVVVLKELILTVSTFGQSGGLERTDFEQFLTVQFLKELILNNFYVGTVWWS